MKGYVSEYLAINALDLIGRGVLAFSHEQCLRLSEVNSWGNQRGREKWSLYRSFQVDPVTNCFSGPSSSCSSSSSSCVKRKDLFSRRWKDEVIPGILQRALRVMCCLKQMHTDRFKDISRTNGQWRYVAMAVHYPPLFIQNNLWSEKWSKKG